MMAFLGASYKIWKLYLVHVVDIFIVAYIFYYLMVLLRGTRSVNIMRGVIILVLVTVASRLLGLKTLFWILKEIWVVGVLALVILFQPELRYLLAQLGKGRLTKFFLKTEYAFLNDILKALDELKNSGHGALLVFEFDIGLKNYIDTGININAESSRELLLSIFTPPSPLHDGAVVIRGEKLVAARVILPLSNEPAVVELLGTRHRAAIGITEVSDACAVVLSEETGAIALAQGGKLRKNMSLEELKKSLIARYQQHVEKTSAFESRI